MKYNITKQVKQEFKTLIDEKGYWSEEVREYIAQFEYTTAKKLHNMAHAYEKYNIGGLTEWKPQ